MVVSHHRRTQGRHTVPHKIADFGSVFLECCDSCGIIRGLYDDDAFLGSLVRRLDLILVAENRMKVGALDWQAGIITSRNALAHFGDVFLDQRCDLWLVGFGHRANTVWQIGDCPFDAVVIAEQGVNIAELRHCCGVMVATSHSVRHSMHAHPKTGAEFVG